MFKMVSLRDVSGFSIRDICNKLNCCRAQVYNLEHGKYNPWNISFYFVKQLSELYGLNMDEIYKILCDDFTEAAHGALHGSEDPNQYKMTFVN